MLALLKSIALYASLAVILLVVVAAIRTVVQAHAPFIKKLDEQTKAAYLILVGAAVALLIWSRFELEVESVEVAGVKANVSTLQKRVSDLEVLFSRKRVETFDASNWNLVQVRAHNPDGSVTLEVILKQEPIPGSVEVLEGPIVMPEQSYIINGTALRFAANTDKPTNTITVKYYPTSRKG